MIIAIVDINYIVDINLVEFNDEFSMNDESHVYKLKITKDANENGYLPLIKYKNSYTYSEWESNKW